MFYGTEVSYGETPVAPEFKSEAVRPIGDHGVSYAQASQDLNINPDATAQLDEGICCRSAAGFFGPGPDEARTAGDCAAQAAARKLKAERDILKKVAA